MVRYLFELAGSETKIILLTAIWRELTMAVALTAAVRFLVCAFAGLWGIAILLGKPPLPVSSLWPLLGVPAIFLTYAVFKSIFGR